MTFLSVIRKQKSFEVMDRYSTAFSEKRDFHPNIRITPAVRRRNLRAYRLLGLLNAGVGRQISRELLELGITRPSYSEMGSAILCVSSPRVENGDRLAVDFRLVNEFSEGDALPTKDVTDV